MLKYYFIFHSLLISVFGFSGGNRCVQVMKIHINLIHSWIRTNRIKRNTTASLLKCLKILNKYVTKRKTLCIFHIICSWVKWNVKHNVSLLYKMNKKCCNHKQLPILYFFVSNDYLSILEEFWIKYSIFVLFRIWKYSTIQKL